MYLFLGLLALLLLTVIIIFAFPRFSPIPYYPSNMKDKQIILDGLKLGNGQTLIDLGAGDGVVIFEAARLALTKKLDTRFVALELNPVLILVLQIRRFFHPNRKNIKIVWGDMFKIDYKTAIGGGEDITFYLYISPWLIERAISHALSFFPKAYFVSYYYPIKSRKNREKKIQGVHALYTYASAKS